MDNDLDNIDTMIRSRNSEDAALDNDALSQIKVSSKPQSWEMDVPNESGNENALSLDSLSNLNDTDSFNQPCRNSIQVHEKCCF